MPDQGDKNGGHQQHSLSPMQRQLKWSERQMVVNTGRITLQHTPQPAYQQDPEILQVKKVDCCFHSNGGK